MRFYTFVAYHTSLVGAGRYISLNSQKDSIQNHHNSLSIHLNLPTTVLVFSIHPYILSESVLPHTFSSFFLHNARPRWEAKPGHSLSPPSKNSNRLHVPLRVRFYFFVHHQHPIQLVSGLYTLSNFLRRVHNISVSCSCCNPIL